MNNTTINELGRYGEHFIITRIEEGKYLVSCYELGIDYDDSRNNYLTKEEYEELHKRYIEIGDPNIDKTDKPKLMGRACNMGNQLSRYYHLFIQRTHDDDYSLIHLVLLMEDIIKRAEVLELDDEKYVDWFLSHGSVESDEYISLMLSFKNMIKNKITIIGDK